MLFEFSYYSSLLLLGFIQGLIYSGLLFYRGYKSDRLSDKLLAWVLVICSFSIAQYMLGFGGWYDSRDGHSTFMFYFPFQNFLFLGPCIYYYFRSLTNEQFKFQRKDLWHFIPGLIGLAFYFFPFILDVVITRGILGEPFNFHSGTQGQWSQFRQNVLGNITHPLGMISALVYIVLTIRQFRQYKAYVLNNFSETEDVELGWLRVVLWTFVIGAGINWGFDLISIFVPFTYAQHWNSFFTTALMIYFFSIPGYSFTYKMPSLDFDPQQSKPDTNDTFPELPIWKTKLEQIMQSEKPYLNADLTLSHLAKMLNTNTSILSKVINQGFQQNFNDFVNAYRVQCMQQKMILPQYQNYTLMSTAFECGFNSKATFNRAFKKFSGISPKEFIKKHQNTNN